MSRRQARESALQLLFQFEFALTSELEPALTSFAENFKVGDIDYVRQLLKGCINHQSELDRVIEAASRNWKIPRMALVDRNILRLASYELLFMHESVPTKVVINEAIELARYFGTEDSPAFVNGVLDQIAAQKGLQ